MRKDTPLAYGVTLHQIVLNSTWQSFNKLRILKKRKRIDFFNMLNTLKYKSIRLVDYISTLKSIGLGFSEVIP